MNLPSFNALQAYGAAKSALKAPDAGHAAHGGAAFEAVKAFEGAVAQGENAAAAFMTGGADPHSVVEAIAAAELAVETAVVIRDKVVEAYQELLRMPV